MIHVHERGHSGGDLALNLAARYAERLVEDLKAALEERIDGESAECESARQTLKTLIDKNASDISGLDLEITANSDDISALEQAVAQNDSDISALEKTAAQNSSNISALSNQHSSDISTINASVSSNKSNISTIQTKLNELSSAQGNLARLLAEYYHSKMTVRESIPEEHKDDMLVNETGIYIDSLDAHSNGLVGPGALFVFADSNGVDVYRFYYSHGSGFYVCSNDEWVSCKSYIKYSASYVVAGNGKTPRPVRIGEWIDDRHVYRYVFGYSLNSDNSTIVSDKSVYSILSEVTKDQNTVFVVNCNAFLRMGGVGEVYDGCCIDDHYVPMLGVGFDSSRLPADYATRFDSFTGYIDFVTTSNNVK